MICIRRSLGDLLSLAGCPAAAAQSYRSALAARPEAETWLRLGVVQASSGRWSAAAEAFRAAVRLQPTCLEAVGGLALSLFRAGRVLEGLGAVEAFVRLRPEEAEAHLLHGALLQRLGRRPEALRALRVAARLQPLPRGRFFVLGEKLLGRSAWEALLERHRAACGLVGAPAPRVRPPLLGGVGRWLRGWLAWLRPAVAWPAGSLRALLSAVRRAVLLGFGVQVARRQPHAAIRSFRAAAGLGLGSKLTLEVATPDALRLLGRQPAERPQPRLVGARPSRRRTAVAVAATTTLLRG